MKSEKLRKIFSAEAEKIELIEKIPNIVGGDVLVAPKQTAKKNFTSIIKAMFQIGSLLRELAPQATEGVD